MNVLSRKITRRLLDPLVLPAVSRLQIFRKSDTLYVDLDAPPKLPFTDANVKQNVCGGWVKLEKQSSGLYVDGRKVVLHFDEGQKDHRTITGYKLKETLADRLLVHPNLLDVLLKHPRFVPLDFLEFFGRNKTSHASIVFLGVVFRQKKKENFCFVRSLRMIERGKLYSAPLWLGSNVGSQIPAAIREE